MKKFIFHTIWAFMFLVSVSIINMTNNSIINILAGGGILLSLDKIIYYNVKVFITKLLVDLKKELENEKM